MTELFAVSLTAAETEVEPGSAGPGSLGFWIVVGLIIVLVFLYLSLRKQLRRVDFDPDATSDEERVASHHEPGEGQEKHDHVEKRDHRP